MDKTFDAAEAEGRIYARWEQNDCFKAGANASRDDTFCIVIPPPNVTGSLHMGHALNNTLQDVLVRWHRMRGFDTLWQPGTDHAGIATQMVVERKLADEGNIRRRDMTRDAFVKKVWEWKQDSGDTILNQLKRLGASCDWSRDRFTMDEGLSKAVLKVFVQLYNEGLIYRGKRLVNWDPQFETAISDLEVENIEVDGHMWHFKYPLAGGATYEYVEKDADGNITLRETRDYISIATTRPETMLGDGAVAVHPSDARYAPIVGKLCEIPVGPKAHRRLIPIITDEYPDPDFGSGAVKITGAHDFNDYGVAKRNNIPCYRLMDTKAAMRDDGAPYTEGAALAQSIIEGAEMSEAEIDAINLVPDELRGLDRYEARKRVIEQISADGLAVMVPAEAGQGGRGSSPGKPEENQSATAPASGPGSRDAVDEPRMIPLVESKKIMAPYGDRSKVVIEPMLTDQWFADAETLAQPAIEAVGKGDVTFVPASWRNTYFHWMLNIEPWCISRQLWWGHQIPVWYGPDLEMVEAWESAFEAQSELRSSLGREITADEWKATLDEAFKGYRKGEGIEICAESEEEAFRKAREVYGQATDFNVIPYAPSLDPANASRPPIRGERGPLSPKRDGRRLVSLWRDPDVLDTWFSSALWPFSTLGWPDATPELARYYPTSVLVTGFDIIFFWVARMMMDGLHFMKDADGNPLKPFDTVYVHALVRDEQGKKMSKSLGNVIDPLEIIDQYGADALRFTLTSMAAMGRDIKLAVSRVEGYRNFGTKLWNAARFAEMNGCFLHAQSTPTAGPEHAPNTPKAGPKPAQSPPKARPAHSVNKWIIGETVRIAAATDAALASYRFNDAANGLYAHVWGVFCDWYVELSKPLLQGEDIAARDETRATMAWALDQCLKLLHPIMPFVTEELWGQIAERGMLIHADWPELSPDLIDPEADAEMGWVIKVIESVRSARAEMNVPGAAQIPMVLTGAGAEVAGRLERNSALIQRLARLSEITLADAAPKGAITVAMEDCALNLPLAGVIDIAAETARLDKALEKLTKEIGGLQGKLANEKFLTNAPENIVAEQRDRLGGAISERDRLTAARQRLSDLA
jgi:valyl-tRNA synthetase